MIPSGRSDSGDEDAGEQGSPVALAAPVEVQACAVARSLQLLPPSPRRVSG